MPLKNVKVVIKISAVLVLESSKYNAEELYDLYRFNREGFEKEIRKNFSSFSFPLNHKDRVIQADVLFGQKAISRRIS